MKLIMSLLFCSALTVSAQSTLEVIQQTPAEKQQYQKVLNSINEVSNSGFLIDIVKDGKIQTLKTSAPNNSGSTTEKIPANPKASKLAERNERTIIKSKPFVTNDGCLLIQKDVIFSNADQYRRYVISITGQKAPVRISKIRFFDNLILDGAKISGYTDGSVIMGDGWFLGVEHPMAKISINQKPIANWTPANFSAGTQSFEIPGNVSGDIDFTFQFEKGKHRVDIESVSIDGNSLWIDKHDGFSGDASNDNVYSFKKLTATDKPKKVIVTFKKTPDTNSFGKITLSSNDKSPVSVSAFIGRNFELTPGETWTFSVVVGSLINGQERRCFQNYLECERAHPYRLFPHYNSWYDLCISRNDNPNPMGRMTEETALKSMREFNKELYKKRGVYIESYLLDDGWDNWDSLWDYHVGFPNKFEAISKEVKAQNSSISAWLSPWGGYGGSKGRRVQNAKKMGLETPNNGLSLAQPKYYKAFRDRCLQMVKDYNMNMFKFDGIGSGTYAKGADEKVAPDLEGLVRLIADLRHAKPDLFINCTVGTWASPFWVLYADSIWRGGDDCDYLGEGPARERWITYRDNIIFDRFASISPLFPLNSIMSHGIIVGNRSVPARMEINDTPEATTAFENEVWMGIACGTGLQEYYISPDLMSQKWWDILADGIKWLRQNPETLRDVHWMGGSPKKAEVYGYASFSPKKGIMIFRNPSSKEQSFTSTLKKVLEIPEIGEGKHLVNVVKSSKTVYSSTKQDATKEFLSKEVQAPFTVKLAPFETLLVEVEF